MSQVTLDPFVVGTDNTWASSGGVGTEVAVVTDANDATYMGPPAPGDDQTFFVGPLIGDPGAPVSSVVVRVRLSSLTDNQSDVKIRARRGSFTEDSASVTGILTAAAWFEFEPPCPGGGAWTLGKVNGAEFGCADPNWSADNPRMVELEVVVIYDDAPPQLRSVRDAATRALLLRSGRAPRFEVNTHIRFGLDKALLDPIQFSHYMFPDVHQSTTGRRTGAGPLIWEAMPSFLVGRTWDADQMDVRLRFIAARNLLYTYRAMGLIRRTYSQQREGVSVVTAGGLESFTRDSTAYARNPGDDLYYEVGENLARHEALGTLPLLESERTNLLIRSAGSLTGLTTGGTGVNGSAIALEDVSAFGTAKLWDTALTINAVRFTKGSPHTADLTLAWPATASVSANTLVRLGAWIREDVGAALAYRLVRNVDGRFWRDSDSTWQVGSTTNTFTEQTGTTVADNMSQSKVIDVGGSATTLTLTVLIPSGGTAGLIARLYQVQLVNTWNVGNPILTTTTSYLQAQETWLVENDSGLRSIKVGRFSFMSELVPNFDAADVPSGTSLFVFAARYDANNRVVLRFQGVGSQRWEFDMVSGGVSTVAYNSSTLPVRGVPIRIGCRATSSVGELGLTALSQSLFVNGVKGTDITRAADPVETATNDLTLGCDTPGASPINGWLRYPWFTQQALSDLEMARDRW